MRLPNLTTESVHTVSAASRAADAVAPSHLHQVAQCNPIVQEILPLLGLLCGNNTSQVKCELKGSTAVPGSPCWVCSDEYGLSTGPMCFSSYPPKP